MFWYVWRDKSSHDKNFLVTSCDTFHEILFSYASFFYISFHGHLNNSCFITMWLLFFHALHSPPPKAHPVQFGRRREQDKTCSHRSKEAIFTSIDVININGWLMGISPSFINTCQADSHFLTPWRIAAQFCLSAPHHVIEFGGPIGPHCLLPATNASFLSTFLFCMFW